MNDIQNKTTLDPGADYKLSLPVYIAVLCFSVSWLFVLPVFTFENYTLFSISIIAGVLLFFPFSFSRLAENCFERLSCWLIVPAFLTALILPWSFRTGPALITVGLLLLLPQIKKSYVYSIGRSCLISGIILTVQSAFLQFHNFLFTGNHDAKWLAGPLAMVFNFLGTDASASGGIVFIKTVNGIEPFRITWEALAAMPCMFFLCGTLVFMMMFSGKSKLLRRLIRFSVLTVFLFAVRYIFVVLVYLYVCTFLVEKAGFSGIFIFWTPIYISISLLPVPFLLSVFFRQNWSRQDPASFKSGCVYIFVPLIAVAVSLFVFSICFQDPGWSKKGRILFDSAHSKWEPFDRPYDTTWYGHDSGYNYAAVYSFLKKIYDVTDSKGELTDKLLANYDILILKIPTAPFTESEKEAIRKFVSTGGGLFLLGEHTNVFGSGFFLNPIAKMFGMSFDYNCVFDIETKFEQMYHTPSIVPHPVIAEMPDFLFEVSCSIKPESIFIEPVIQDSGLKTIDIDYSSRNFYPQVENCVDMRFGTFLQAAARKYGKGRVVAFSDSTCYSNFSAFHQGKPEFLLGTLSWLNRRNTILTLFFRVMSVLFFCMVLMLLITVFIFYRPKSNFLVHTIVWTGFAVVFSMFAANSLNRWLNPVTTLHKLPPMLAFEREHCDYDLPDFGFITDYYRSFGIFHQWILRVDHFPRTFSALDECIENSECVILIRPFRDFSKSEIKKIDEFVRNGGKLLVMDDLINKHSSSNRLLENFGISFDFGKPIEKNKIMTMKGRQILCDVEKTMPVRGGTPLLYSVNGKPLATYVKHGKGMVVVCSVAGRFSDTGMGVMQGLIPNGELLVVYALEFDLIKGIMSNDIEQYLKRITPPKISPKK